MTCYSVAKFYKIEYVRLPECLWCSMSNTRNLKDFNKFVGSSQIPFPSKTVLHAGDFSQLIILTWIMYHLMCKVFWYNSIVMQKRHAGEISRGDVLLTCWKTFSKGKMTYLYRSEGQEMAPTIPGKHETLLIRHLPSPDAE